jgi:HK97 family phage portal protein
MLVSGVLSSFLERMTAKAVDADKYLDATVTTSDLAVSRYRQSGDAGLIARCRQMILNYAALNARVCAGQTMRLYTKSKRGRKSIKSRRRNDYLRNPQRGYGPGSKAARRAEQAGDVEEVTDHPALYLLNAANPWQRGTSFSQFCFFQWQIFGRRYVHVVGEGEPESLWCLTAQHVKIVPDREKLIGGFVYGRDGASDELFSDEEILYQRLMCSPFNPYDAIGPLHAAMEDADIYSAATTSELATWQNGARPDWVLSVPTGTPEAQIKQLQASVNGQMRGPKKRGNFLITSLTDAKNLQFSPREMEYLAGKADLRKTMRSAFGIPESVDENNSANLASALMGHTQYMRYTIGPTINQDAEEWSETLLPKFGIEPGEMWFAYDDCVPADRAETRADIQAFIPAGVWSVNEARAEIGFDTLDDPKADEHRLEQPAPMTPFGGFGGPGANAKPDDGEDDEDETPAGETGPQGADEENARSKSAPAPCSCGCDKSSAKVPKSRGIVTKDDRQTSAAKVEAAMQADVEKWYKDLAARGEIDDAGNIKNLAQHQAELEKILRPHIVQMFEVGSRQGLASVGQNVEDAFSVYADRAVGFMNQHTVQLARTITTSAADSLRTALATGIGEGETLNERTSRVMEALGEEAPWRAERIARTESARAMHEGNIEAWKATGVVGKRWMLSGDACPMCKAAAEKINKSVGVGAPFLSAGDELKYEGGSVVLDRSFNTPPLHPNCVLPGTIVLPGSVIAATRAMYRGNVVTVRTARGNRLAVTENHLVLTRRGFVRAASLSESDYLINAAACQFGGDPDAQNMPAAIEKVFDACRVSGAMTAHSVPVAAEYLHGDGSRINGKIDVVAANGLLMRDVEAMLSQTLGNMPLVSADAELQSLAGCGDLDAMLIGLRLAADGSVSGSRDALSVVGCQVGHEKLRGLAAVSLANPGGVETLDDGDTGASEHLGECLDRMALFGVQSDEVVGIEVREYAGHVYDLSTVSGAYIADGIITHNCGCFMEPVFEWETEGA